METPNWNPQLPYDTTYININVLLIDGRTICIPHGIVKYDGQMFHFQQVEEDPNEPSLLKTINMVFATRRQDVLLIRFYNHSQSCFSQITNPIVKSVAEVKNANLLLVTFEESPGKLKIQAINLGHRLTNK